MAESAPLTENNHYEQACDQAIAMCGGDMRGAIKALIMANEYLEAELQELQAEVSNDAQPRLPTAKSNAA
jgi:DNA polymerase III delta prime subunit